MLHIPAEAEKGNQDRLLPITPEFATLLEGVRECERRGRVFKLLDINGILLPTRLPLRFFKTLEFAEESLAVVAVCLLVVPL